MVEAHSDEAGDGEEDGGGLGRQILVGRGHPDGHADEPVAEDAAGERDLERRGDLAHGDGDGPGPDARRRGGGDGGDGEGPEEVARVHDGQIAREVLGRRAAGRDLRGIPTDSRYLQRECS